MNRYVLKMLLRSIRSTLGRYLALLAIVALGVGFFAGLKSSMPAMVSTADVFLRAQRLHDYRLLSTLGFTEEDEADFAASPGTVLAEGAYFTDALAEAAGRSGAWHFMSLTEQVSIPVLTAGRMPVAATECLADARAFSTADIGKAVTISEENDEDTLELLSRRSYTIVGLARSPRYISFDRGSTSLGSGRLEGFFLLTGAGFSSEAYHEMLLWCDLPGEIYSDTYDAARDRLKDDVEKTLNRLGRRRSKELRMEAETKLLDAQKEIDDGWTELAESRAEAEQELSDAAKELRDARRKLTKGWAEVKANQNALDAAMKKIPSARKEIAAGRRQIAAGRKEIAAGRAQVAAGRAQLEAGRAQLRESEKQVEQLREAYGQTEAQLAALQEELRELQAQPEPDREAEAKLEAQITRLSAAAAQMKAQLQAAETALAQGQRELAARKKELDKAEKQLNSAEKELDKNEKKLNRSEQQLNKLEKDYPANKKKLDAARRELNQGEADLAQGWVDYADGQRELEEKITDGERELNDAQKEVDDARAELPDKLRLDVYTLDRNANTAYVTFGNDTRIVDAIALAFPVFFALIAALVCVTTMTRMVNDERTLIGTMKAMGYGQSAIMSKYLLYAGSSALLGCVGGFFLGTEGLPRIVWVAYNIMYTIDDLRYYFSPWMWTACLLTAVPGALLVTWLACRKELAEKPAELIRPKAPAAGKRIVLEYITPLWRRLSFLSKVTVRNSFRYRQRVAMMLLGIGGCTALLVTGFGIQDSIVDVSRYQYGEITLYDVSVVLDTDEIASDAEAAAYWAGDAERAAFTWQEAADVVFQGREKSTKVVAARGEDLAGLIDFHTGDTPLAYPGPGEALVATKIAERLGISPGDRVRLRPDGGGSTEVVITGVCDNYLRDYIYVSPETVGSPRNNTVLLQLREGADGSAVAARLRDEKGVSYVNETARERETIDKSMNSFDLLVVTIVACSGALAFITLYNLTNINIMERTREIATVKVLGFYPGETAAYILRENLMLSALGAAAGLGLGKLLHRFVITLVDVDYLALVVRVLPRSYVYSFIITLLFAAFTNLVMRAKLEKVDMAESLKSVE